MFRTLLYPSSGAVTLQ